MQAGVMEWYQYCRHIVGTGQLVSLALPMNYIYLVEMSTAAPSPLLQDYGYVAG